MMAEREKVIYVYGDSSRRETYGLPRTLKALQKRAFEVLGKQCQIWHCMNAKGRLDASARLQIKTQADFQQICHDDVVILVDPSNGQEISLGACLDDLTIYKRDYTTPKHPTFPQQHYSINMTMPELPDINALAFKTTYTRDFPKHQQLKRSGQRPLLTATDPSPLNTKAPFNGTTTYRDEYQPHSFTLEPDSELKPFEPDSPPTSTWTQSYETMYAAKFKAHNIQPKVPKASNPTPPPHASQAALWRPTEYKEEYIKHPFRPTDPDDMDEFTPVGFDAGPATQWQSMYKADFRKPNLPQGQQLHYDPELVH